MRGIAGKAGWRYVRQTICCTSLNLRTVVWQLALFGRVRLFTCNHAFDVGTYPLYVRGLITLTVGIATFFMMPSSPTHTRTWFRPKGWFTEREEYISTARILRDDPTKVCRVLRISFVMG